MRVSHQSGVDDPLGARGKAGRNLGKATTTVFGKNTKIYNKHLPASMCEIKPIIEKEGKQTK